ncbi:peptide deformylase [Methylococcus geothermalis]|uniref:peptide deformylase n=1 Tax=Methylococcus geothermalis TaxID=2681310 RepID=UPI001E563416|nr:peptide deformylase [Methylococcus geothermalis]
MGLAAPQIGLGLQLAVIEDRADDQKGMPAEELAARGREPVPFHVIVNPEIVARSEETDVFHEGCLSLAGFSARVERARSVRVSCLDQRGEAGIIEASGRSARILQPQIDRMDPSSFTSQATTPAKGTAKPADAGAEDACKAAPLPFRWGVAEFEKNGETSPSAP